VSSVASKEVESQFSAKVFRPTCARPEVNSTKEDFPRQIMQHNFLFLHYPNNISPWRAAENIQRIKSIELRLFVLLLRRQIWKEGE
jgi:hypothetical protein